MEPQPAEWIDVRIVCMRRGCQSAARLPIRVTAAAVDIDPPADWVFYTLGYPSATNLGVCPEHKTVTLDDGEGVPIVVHAERRTHGVYFEMIEGGARLGAITFPANTRAMQFEPGFEPTEAARRAGIRVAVAFGFFGWANY